MSLVRTVLTSILKALPTEEAYAHCDIPCGIYDPHAAKIAAQTVVKMVQLINDLPTPAAAASAQDWAKYEHSVTRYVAMKEEHAQLCKKELLILWSDYFKPQHLEKHPDLHTIFWNAAKLCSKNKQEVNAQAAQELVGTVDKIAAIFWDTKKT